jgi:hypothetical protein
MKICNGSLYLISRNFRIFNLSLKKFSKKLSKYPEITEFLKYEFNYCLTYVPTMVSSMTIYFARLTFHLVELYMCCEWALCMKVRLKTSQYISNEV